MTLPKPYYQKDNLTLYCADCRDILPELGQVETIITDPVWPNALPIYKAEDPQRLFTEMCEAVYVADRLVVQLGCDSDPRFLQGVPVKWPFIRVCWLDYACPSYKGRLLYTGDVAYDFGSPPKSIPGRHVLPGKYTSTRSDKLFERHTGRNRDGRRTTGSIEYNLPHPSPRRLQHVEWLVWVFSDQEVVDPFAGSGTTLLAAKHLRRKAIGIEINEEYCQVIVKRLSELTMDLDVETTYPLK